MALRHALLGLLSQNSASGWDLQQTFDGSLANVWPASHSQVYTELNKMSAAGLVTVSTEGPRGRKEYAITPAGQAEWLEWMMEDPDDLPRRSDMLLKVFFLDFISAEETAVVLDKIEQRAIRHEQGLTALAARLETQRGPLVDGGSIALEYGLRLARLQQEWAQWARGQAGAPDNT